MLIFGFSFVDRMLRYSGACPGGEVPNVTSFGAYPTRTRTVRDSTRGHYPLRYALVLQTFGGFLRGAFHIPPARIIIYDSQTYYIRLRPVIISNLRRLSYLTRTSTKLALGMGGVLESAQPSGPKTLHSSTGYAHTHTL